MGSHSEFKSELDEAERQLNKGNRAEAVMIYHDLRDRADRDPGLQYRLGLLAFNFGDVDQAAEHFEIAVEAQPENTDYLCALGIALQSGGAQIRAAEAFQRALGIKDDLHDALHGLGVFYINRGQGDKAVEVMLRAERLKPSDLRIRINLAYALTLAGRHDEAIEHARKAVRIDPKSAEAHYELCKALTEKGQIEETVQHLRKTIRENRLFGPAYDVLARVRKFTAEDDDIVNSAEKALKGSMPPLHRYSLHFALGKMHADRGDYGKSYEHYEKANTLQDPGVGMDHHVRLSREVRSSITAKLLRDLADAGNPTRKPVFIVGMPRTGTTLMEQIIDAHPEAAGAGESPMIGQIASRFFPDEKPRNLPAFVREQLSPEVIAECAEQYLEVISTGREEAERIVDKMPANHFFVGLIRILFPNATVIHSERHPLDTALSCFRQNFATQPWTNSAESIARYYGLYLDLMAYWEKVLPEGSITTVRYEELVADPETQARRLLDACGLEWDPSVLDFFRKESVVKTASIAQVRQPIYKTSQQNWLKYGKHVEPLAKAMAPYLQEDRELLAEHGIDIGGKSPGEFFRRLFG